MYKSYIRFELLSELLEIDWVDTWIKTTKKSIILYRLRTAINPNIICYQIMKIAGFWTIELMIKAGSEA